MLRYLQRVVGMRPETPTSISDPAQTKAEDSPAPTALAQALPPLPSFAGRIRQFLHVIGTGIRRRPKTSVSLFLLVLLSGAVAGVYVYADRQWQAAQAAVKQGRFADAKKNLDVCLFFWPRSIPVHLLAARADRNLGDFDAAEAHLNLCLKLHQGATEDIQLEFLLMRVQQGEEDEVAPALRIYVNDNHPERTLIFETLSRAYMRQFRYGPAYDYLCHWIHEEPDAAQPYFWRGWVTERLNNPEAAMRDYERAVELNPDFTAARLRLAELWLEKSNPVEALPHLQRLTKQHPDRPDIMARLGECYFLQGESEEARRLLEAAVKKLPDDPSLLVHLAKLDLQEARPAEAEKRLRYLLKLDPYSLEAHFPLIESLRRQGREQEAEAAHRQFEKYKAQLLRANELLSAETAHPTQDPSVLAEAGALLLLMGHDQQGEYWLQKALERDPQHEPALKALADFYERKGEAKAADAYRRRLANTEKVAPKSSTNVEAK